jgi:hypothetical protein
MRAHDTVMSPDSGVTRDREPAVTERKKLSTESGREKFCPFTFDSVLLIYSFRLRER